jgi:hypothetical protein
VTASALVVRCGIFFFIFALATIIEDIVHSDSMHATSSSSVATSTTATRLMDHCAISDFLHSCKEALSTVDLLRRTIRMLLDGSIHPLETLVLHYSASIALECRNLEDAMTSCLADTTLERFVNSNGVAQMMRDTTRRWCSGTQHCNALHSDHAALHEDAIRLTQDLHSGTYPGVAEAVGSQRAVAVRQRLIDVVEMSVVRMSLITMPALSDPLDDQTAACHMNMIVQRIQQCAEGAFSVYVQILRNGRASEKEGAVEHCSLDPTPLSSSWAHTLTPARSSTCTLSTQAFREYATADPSPGFEVQSQCAELMGCLQRVLNKSSDPDHVLIPEEGLPAAKCLLSLLLELQAMIHSITTVAVDAMDLVNSYAEAAGVKEAELRAMVKWYCLSSQAAREWRKEAARREVVRQSHQQRTIAMQRELDRMVDEESLSRSSFANRWAAYLPKGGFASVGELPVQLRIVSDSAMSSSANDETSALSGTSSKNMIHSPKR